MQSNWTRRAWLARTGGHAATLAALTTLPRAPRWRVPPGSGGARGRIGATATRVAAQGVPWEPAPLQAAAQQAVEAARAAGARYADARLTRSVVHAYSFGGPLGSTAQQLTMDSEVVGFGVRALVKGYWGFAAEPYWTAEAAGAPDTAVRLARAAVAQAQVNAGGTPRTVELGALPVATGTWATPVRIDPFSITIDEKLDYMAYWQTHAHRNRVYVKFPMGGRLGLVRQERIVATSEGTLITQTLYSIGGSIQCLKDNDNPLGSLDPNGGSMMVQGLEWVGGGWEYILDAQIPQQLETMSDRIAADTAAKRAAGAKPSVVGRYTLVCDGATMASLLGSTLGVATQLDRALGYEANAGGTSFLDDPLAMVGQYRVASPLVTVTANRTAPTQLATVKWDDEGVEPPPVTLVQDGVLTDFQTTREQAAWLAPYYATVGRPVRSNGCAGSADALVTPLQMMPNLALAPSSSAVRLEDLVADVADGRLVIGGEVLQVDAQARNGLLVGQMREIKNGKLGRWVNGGTVLFNSSELWKHIQAVGGASTEGGVVGGFPDGLPAWISGGHGRDKGQPSQGTPYSVRGVAAVLPNQPIINVGKKG